MTGYQYPKKLNKGKEVDNSRRDPSPREGCSRFPSRKFRGFKFEDARRPSPERGEEEIERGGGLGSKEDPHPIARICLRTVQRCAGGRSGKGMEKLGL